jgi:hypothetical protein
LIRNGIKISAATVMDKYAGKDSTARMLIPIFQKHNDEVATLVPKGFCFWQAGAL